MKLFFKLAAACFTAAQCFSFQFCDLAKLAIELAKFGYSTDMKVKKFKNL
jgi:hypothetical protein